MAQLVRKGKTKDVFRLEGDPTKLVLAFKDDVTGHADGTIDPGANQVIAKSAGQGNACLRMTTHFYEKLNAQMRTHFISSNLSDNTMVVTACKPYGPGIEVLIRYVSTGSWMRRFEKYGAKEGQALIDCVEFSIKDDDGGDPIVSDTVLINLGIATATQLDEMRKKALVVGSLVRQEMAEKNLTLYDIKIEFGQDGDGNMVLIDEIGPGSMRAYQGDTQVKGISLSQLFFGINITFNF